MSERLRTLVAMRWPVHQDAVRAALVDHVDVVGTASDVSTALGVLKETAIDVLVVEVGLDGGGNELCAAVKADDRWVDSVRVLVIGPCDDEAALIDAVHAGADGYVSEDDGVGDLTGALDRMSRGEASIPSAMLGGLLRTLIKDRREEDLAIERFSRLSNREREVLALLVAGHDNAGIAEQMIVSTNTARTHVQNIFRKLEVSSRLEAASLVTTFGLLERFPIDNHGGTAK